jgi:hypothetical protein
VLAHLHRIGRKFRTRSRFKSSVIDPHVEPLKIARSADGSLNLVVDVHQIGWVAQFNPAKNHPADESPRSGLPGGQPRRSRLERCMPPGDRPPSTSFAELDRETIAWDRMDRQPRASRSYAGGLALVRFLPVPYDRLVAAPYPANRFRLESVLRSPLPQRMLQPVDIRLAMNV